MATAAPHVKLLRQLASAKEDYLSGAFDVSWDGAKATIFLVFGQPSHAVYGTDSEQLEGEAAIDALLAELPRNFAVSDWRRTMSPHETLEISLDDLAAPFVRLAGERAGDPVVEEAPEWWSAEDDSPELSFGLADFPPLPGGRPLWPEGPAGSVRLAEQLASLPPSILILTGARLRAAAVVTGGDIIDAVWIDAEDHAVGETAGMALLGARTGSLAGYALDDPAVADALPMLWRLPVTVSGVDLAWLDPASMLAAFRADGADRVLIVNAPVRGIALFSNGGLVAVYSETHRGAVASPERLRSLLSQSSGTLSVMARQSRRTDREAQRGGDAFEFFNVADDELPDDEELQPVEDRHPVEGPHIAGEDAPVEEQPHATTEAEAADAEAEAASAPDLPDEEPQAASVPDLPGEEPQAASVPDLPGEEPQAASVPDLPGEEPQAGDESEPAKRPWWAFGTTRRARPDDHDTSPPEGADAAPAGIEAAADAAAPNGPGWMIRERAPDWYAPPAEHAATEAAETETQDAEPEPDPEPAATTIEPQPEPEPVVQSPEPIAAAASPEPEPSAAGPVSHRGLVYSTEDEPVGSSFVDFNAVRRELVRIAVVWLGETNAGQASDMLMRTRATIDDFVSTIDTIRSLHVPGQDPASIQAMAREMHHHAAERLCGA